MGRKPIIAVGVLEREKEKVLIQLWGAGAASEGGRSLEESLSSARRFRANRKRLVEGLFCRAPLSDGLP